MVNQVFLPLNMEETERHSRTQKLIYDIHDFLFDISCHRIKSDEYKSFFVQNVAILTKEYLTHYLKDNIDDIDMMYIYHHFLGDNFGIEDKHNFICNPVRKIQKRYIVEMSVKSSLKNNDFGELSCRLNCGLEVSLTVIPLPFSVISQILASISL